MCSLVLAWSQVPVRDKVSTSQNASQLTSNQLKGYLHLLQMNVSTKKNVHKACEYRLLQIK